MPDRSHRRACGRSETARSRPGTGEQPGRRHREPPPRETAVLHHRAARWASCRSKLRSLGSRSRLIGSGSSSSAGATIGSRLLARVSTDELVPASSRVDVADGTRAVSGPAPVALVFAVNASGADPAGSEGPTSLWMAFSLTPRRCAIARLLMPWVFNVSILRRHFPEIRRRPRRQPASRPRAAIPPCAKRDSTRKACWVLMRGAKADKFESAQGPPKSLIRSAFYASTGEKTGHVLVRTVDAEKPSDFSRANRVCQEV